VYSHLVTVEVGVERSTDKWVQLNSLTLNQYWLKGLNSKAVKGRCAV
jgi:hypothetical protein